ncbi:MAG TPA: nucleoside hydrolase [Chitinophagaceae bacterium]|nr:nucleoside hydrolase [Chitinophagaceae bacterium]
MKQYWCWILLAWMPAAVLFSQPSHPVRIVFDSDMGPDYDDVGAIALLHAFADRGEAEILATVSSTRYEGVAAVLQVFNTYFRRPGIPIGVAGTRALTLRDWQHWTDTILQEFPHAISHNQDVPDAVQVYRRVLAAQPDRSVTIVTTGFLTNLDNLLASPPDSLCPLDGLDLVRRKVMRLVCMGGRFPEGKEFNLEKDAEASRAVLGRWPTPVIFSGFEIGKQIKTGLPLIRNEHISQSPVKRVFAMCIPRAPEDSAGRMSWDETAVLVAVRGVCPWYRLKKGHIRIRADGSNAWQDTPADQAYLVEKTSPAILQDLINRLMMHQPAGTGN